MTKVLFYINKLSDGGAERVMANLANQFSVEGVDVVVITSYRTQGEYPLHKNIKRYALEEPEIVQSRVKKNLSRIKKLRRICINENADIAVSFMMEPNFRMLCATRGLPVKTIVSVRNDPNQEYAGIIGRFVGKVLLPMADGCVFQTEDAKRWFSKRLQKKSTVIFNAVKESFYGIDRELVPGKIVSCGRLVEQKNQKLLIDAFAMIADKHPKANLDIYGEGNLETVLQQQIDDIGLQERALLKGQVSNVEQVLKSAAVFVLTSDYEGMPNALMEALAAGVPSISTDCPCGGPRMLIKNGENGLLVPVGDISALANALDILLTEHEFARNLGAVAKASAENYRTERVFSQWRQFFDKVAEGLL